MQAFLIEGGGQTLALIARSSRQAQQYRAHYYPKARWIGADTRSHKQQYESQVCAVAVHPAWRPLRPGEGAETYLREIGEMR